MSQAYRTRAASTATPSQADAERAIARLQNYIRLISGNWATEHHIYADCVASLFRPAGASEAAKNLTDMMRQMADAYEKISGWHGYIRDLKKGRR